MRFNKKKLFLVLVIIGLLYLCNIYISGSPNINTSSLTVEGNIKKVVLGYSTYYSSGDTSSYISMTNNCDLLDELATDTYSTDCNGKISGLVPTNQINYANSKNIKTLAMITNNSDAAMSKTLLENPTNRQALINNILNVTKANNYKGVNIDFEGLYYYDRTYLTKFINELYVALHAEDLYVTIAVPAKTKDNTTSTWSGAFDYAALAKCTDQIVIMAYDEHSSNGPAGPVASTLWVENVIKYAIKTIPKTKLLLGMAAYGYDWSSNSTKAKASGIPGIYNLAATYKSSIKLDSTSHSPYFTYLDTSKVLHTVWFENADSLNFKLNLVNSYNLSGIAIWRLGLEDANYWTSIKTKFKR